MTGGRPVLGILGAGRLGVVLTRHASAAGYRVLLAGSGAAARVGVPAGAAADTVTPTTVADAAAGADVVILALPLGRYRSIPAAPLAGKLVLDAMNYWWEVDGYPAEFTDPLVSSSELVQAHLPAARVVKAFNHMGYHDLEDEARPAGAPGRKAIGIAGDAAADLEIAAGIVDDLGFDPVIVGSLADGITLEPGTEPFGADVDVAELRALIARFADSQRGRRRAAALRAQG